MHQQFNSCAEHQPRNLIKTREQKIKIIWIVSQNYTRTRSHSTKTYSLWTRLIRRLIQKGSIRKIEKKLGKNNRQMVFIPIVRRTFRYINQIFSILSNSGMATTTINGANMIDLGSITNKLVTLGLRCLWSSQEIWRQIRRFIFISELKKYLAFVVEI